MSLDAGQLIDLSYNDVKRGFEMFTQLDWLWKNVEPIIFNVT